MVWYSHLLNNFPQFVVIHTLCCEPKVKGFSIFNEIVVDVFQELSCFFYELTGVGSLISDSSAFSKSKLKLLEAPSSHTVEA